jgi:hypothetical protein
MIRQGHIQKQTEYAKLINHNFLFKEGTLQMYDTVQNYRTVPSVVQRLYQHNLKTSHYRHI